MTERQPFDRAADDVAPEDAAPPEARDETATDGAPEDDAATIEGLRAELEEARRQHLRAAADYQNLQRRSQQERAEYTRHAQVALVLNFLPVLDDLNRALDAVDSAADEGFVEGVRLVRQKFWGVLESMGVREVEALGKSFDPQVHEAVSYAPGPEGQVVQLVHAGFTMNDRVVRPAMVLVGNGEDAAGASN
ncbi:MAG: nucleotide exchange factor GrpE [Dehalococcoidia bacterium]|nr:nucleotide exchange factor GrpE [Dehalococcoidia bacterium]